MRIGYAAVLLGTLFLDGCVPAAPVPEGYVFPTRERNSGPAALLLGELFERDGCLYVRAQTGDEFFVVWPNNLRLVIDDLGVPTIMKDSQAVARVGDSVSVDGGLSEAASPYRDRCPGDVFLASELVRG